jgi:diacylglycerol kinase family enzyme
MAQPAWVFLNPGATYGTGRERWARVESEVAGRLGEMEVEETRSLEGTTARLGELMARGVTRLVAAGGDGTVNLLVNAMMALGGRLMDDGASDPRDSLTLGAVGLGSSNDFHKPYGPDDTIEGMPVHLDFGRARERDVIEIAHEGTAGAGRRYSLVNASIGVTAEANARFNEPNLLVRALRPFSVDAAITAAVLTTLSVWRDVTCAVSTDGADPQMVSVTNLGVFKNPHFGGELCYEFAPERDDGTLGVALCEGMSARETLRTLSGLRERSFSGPKTRSWKAKSIVASGDREFALETDGEVELAKRVEFRVAERRIRCCA